MKCNVTTLLTELVGQILFTVWQPLKTGQHIVNVIKIGGATALYAPLVPSALT